MGVMLDSGSVPTLVDPDRTRELGLAFAEGGSAIGTAGGAAAAWRTGGFSLSVAGITLQFPPESVLAIDLTGFAGGIGVGAILGRALFESARLDFDLPKARMRVADAARPEGWTSLPLKVEDDGLRCAPIQVGAHPQMAATFDLGATIPLQVSRAWAQANGLLAGLRQSSWVITGLDGVNQVTTAVLPRVDLAGFILSNVPVAITDSQPEGASPAVIGMPVWRRFRLLSDFAAGTLWLKPDAAMLEARFNRDRSGLAVRFTGDALEVIHIAEAGPAETAGWTVGERIVAVNGQAVNYAWPVSRQSGWARQRAGARVRLTLADGRQRDLVLADYY